MHGEPGINKPVSPKTFTIDPKGNGFTYTSLASRLSEIVGREGSLKVLEEKLEYDPEKRMGPGVFRYRFNKTEYQHEFVHFWARINLGAVREMVDAFDCLDDGRRFYYWTGYGYYTFFYLLDSEAANSVAMKSDEAPQLHVLDNLDATGP